MRDSGCTRAIAIEQRIPRAQKRRERTGIRFRIRERVRVQTHPEAVREAIELFEVFFTPVQDRRAGHYLVDGSAPTIRVECGKERGPEIADDAGQLGAGLHGFAVAVAEWTGLHEYLRTGRGCDHGRDRLGKTIGGRFFPSYLATKARAHKVNH